MVVAAGQQGGAGGRAQGSGVKAIVLEAALGQALEGGRLTGSAKGTRRAKANVIKQDNQHIGRAFRGAQLGNRRKAGLRVPSVAGNQAGV